MVAEIRTSQLRQAREGIDTGRGVLRTAGNPTREAAIGRGSFVNWYKDLGVSTTEPAAQQLRNDESDFQSRIAEKRAKVNEAKGQLGSAWGELGSQEAALNAAAGQVPDLGSAVQGSWDQFRSSFIPVRVIEGDTQWVGDTAAEGGGWQTKESVGATYYFPKEVAESLMGQKGIVGSWSDNGFNVYARHYNNKDLHSIFSSQANILESSYKEKAANQIAGQLGSAQYDLSGQYAQLGEAKGTLSGYQTQVDIAEEDLNTAIAKRQAQWDELRGKQSDKLDKMNEILSGLFIKKGTKE